MLAVVVDPGPDRSGMEIVFVIRMMIWLKVLHRLQFLTQPSLFIWAWDQHYLTLTVHSLVAGFLDFQMKSKICIILKREVRFLCLKAVNHLQMVLVNYLITTCNI